MDYEQIDMDRLLEGVKPVTVIDTIDPERGTFEQRTVHPLQGAQLVQEHSLLPYPRDMQGHITLNEHKVFLEAARGRAMTSNFGDLLRMGLNFDAMSSYAGIPLVLKQIIGGETLSMLQQEEYLKDASFGIAKIVHEGAEYPEAAMDLDDGVIIKNHKRGFKVPVTEEMRRFDQLGKVRDLAQQMGFSLAITEEYAVAELLTTAGNYTRTEAAGDNDQGNNTTTVTFSASGMETALNTLMTMKDKNGTYLGVQPNVLWCAPKVLSHAVRLIRARTVIRTGGTTEQVDGTGQQNNPLFGSISTIVSSPYLGKEYEWGLVDNSRGAIKFQRVDQAQVRGPNFDEGTDTFWFYPRTWFGIGFKDDRFAFYSPSTTRPTVT